MANSLAVNDPLSAIFDVEAALTRAIERALAGAGMDDLTVTNLRVLRYVRDAEDNGEPLTMAMLAALMVQQHHAATGQLNRLAARGLVTREPNPQDGRSAFAVLTPAGRELLRRADAVYEAFAGQVERDVADVRQLGSIGRIARRMLPLADVDLKKRVEASKRLGSKP